MTPVTILRPTPQGAPSTQPVQIATGVLVSIQDDSAAGAKSIIHGPVELPDALYTRHTIYARRRPLPDVRVGDQIVDPGDVDPLSQQPAVYYVETVRHWSHLEIEARRLIVPFTSATRYDSTVANPQPLLLFLSNIKSIVSRRDASTFVSALVPMTAGLAPGHVVNAGTGWYLTIKTGLAVPFSATVEAMLLALPYQLTVKRPSAAQKTGVPSVWGSPAGATTTSEAMSGTAASYTIRAGFSNAADPIDENVEGPLPRTGTWTLYTPSGSNVQRGDTIYLPDGRPGRIERANALASDGLIYATQLQVVLSSGSGLT